MTLPTAPATYDPALERLEVELLLEAVYRHYGFDFRTYAYASLRRRVWKRIQAERLETVSDLQAAVLHDPAHPYAQALVSAIPHPGRRQRRILLQGDPPNPADRPSGCAFHPRCPAAVALCAREDPVLKPRPGDGRHVACHVAQGDAPAPSDGRSAARRGGPDRPAEAMRAA